MGDRGREVALAETTPETRKSRHRLLRLEQKCHSPLATGAMRRELLVLERLGDAVCVHLGLELSHFVSQYQKVMLTAFTVFNLVAQ